MAIDTTTSVDVQTLTPFKKFIMTLGALPTSYLESMTYAELVMWFCNYLQNDVIPTVNNNGEAVEELQGLYEELKEYVNNYFDNLDIQEEVNNKLDALVQDGTLTRLIGNYIDPIVSIQNDEITSINNKVNAVASGSPAGVYATVSDLETANPDHSKIYLVSADGKWYYYSSGAWTAGGTYQSSESLDVLNMLKVDVDDLKKGYETFSSYSECKVGAFVYGEFRTTNLKRVCTVDLMHFDRPIEIHVADGYRCDVIGYTSAGVYTTDLAYVTGPNTYTIPTTRYFKVCIRLADETGALDNPDIATFMSKVTFKTLIQEHFDTIDDEIDALETSDEQIRYSNYKFEDIDFTNGKYITRIEGTGYIGSDEASCATNYVEVKPNALLKISNLYLSGNRTVATYDKSHNTIACLTSESSSATEMVIEIDEDVRYVKATGRVNVCPTFEYLSITSQDEMEEFIKTNGYTDLYEQATKYPVVSFIDDDTPSPNLVTLLKERCDDVGIKISFAGLTSNIGDSSYHEDFINLLLGYERDGFPTIMHGYTQGEFYRQANRDLADCEDDLVHAIQDMTKWGFSDFKCCWATPYGEYDDELKSLAYKWGFQSLVRYSSQENVEDPTKLNPEQRYQLYRYTFEDADDIPTIKTLIDKAVACKGWLIIGVHSSYPYIRGDDFPAGLAEVVDYATDSGCSIRTVNEELRRRMPIYNQYEKY